MSNFDREQERYESFMVYADQSKNPEDIEFFDDMEPNDAEIISTIWDQEDDDWDSDIDDEDDSYDDDDEYDDDEYYTSCADDDDDSFDW